VASAILSRRILGAVAFALVFGMACILLGRWQLSRAEEKDVRATAVETNYRRAAVPLESVLPQQGAPLGDTQVWTHVTTSGGYAAPQLLVRNRAFQGTQGVEVLVPLRLDDGSLLVVDRGWLPYGQDAASVPVVPAAPGGRVTVSGWLKPGEESRDRDLPSGQLATVDLGAVATLTGGRVHAAYLVLGEEAPTPTTRPTLLDAPSPERGPHLAYALQWFGMAVFGVAFVVFLYRNRPEAVAAREVALATAGSKPKKVRIWDEEDE